MVETWNEAMESEYRDILVEIGDPAKSEEYLKNIKSAIECLGFKYYSIAFGELSEEQPHHDTMYLFSNYPPKFNEEYYDGGYANHDKGVSHTLRSSHPVFWFEQDSDVLSGPKNTREYELIELGRKHGITYGVTIPGKFRRKQLPFALSLVIDQKARNEGLIKLFNSKRILIDELLNCAHHACPVSQLVIKATKLRPMDIEVLRLKAQKLSNAQIEILLREKGFLVKSESTVKNKVSRAYDKLFRRVPRIGRPNKKPKAETLRKTLSTFELL